MDGEFSRSTLQTKIYLWGRTDPVSKSIVSRPIRTHFLGPFGLIFCLPSLATGPKNAGTLIGS